MSTLSNKIEDRSTTSIKNTSSIFFMACKASLKTAIEGLAASTWKVPFRYFRLWKSYNIFIQNKETHNIQNYSFMPIFEDQESAGSISAYFYQDIWAARHVFKNNPVRHIDIGSRVDGFVAQVSVFRDIEVLDIRSLTSQVTGIKFLQADLIEFPTHLAASCDSISSLHAIEHFGLGRYGDPLDPDGHIKAISNIHRMLTPNGKFYFSVPIGPLRIEFNAHRIFSLPYLLKILEPLFMIHSFSYVDDHLHFHENVPLTEPLILTNAGCKKTGCGMFELIKK